MSLLDKQQHLLQSGQGPLLWGSGVVGLPRSSTSPTHYPVRGQAGGLELKSHPGQLNYYYEIHKSHCSLNAAKEGASETWHFLLGIEICRMGTKHQERTVTGDFDSELAT